MIDWRPEQGMQQTTFIECQLLRMSTGCRLLPCLWIFCQCPISLKGKLQNSFPFSAVEPGSHSAHWSSTGAWLALVLIFSEFLHCYFFATFPIVAWLALSASIIWQTQELTTWRPSITCQWARQWPGWPWKQTLPVYVHMFWVKFVSLCIIHWLGHSWGTRTLLPEQQPSQKAKLFILLLPMRPRIEQGASQVISEDLDLYWQCLNRMNIISTNLNLIYLIIWLLFNMVTLNLMRFQFDEACFLIRDVCNSLQASIGWKVFLLKIKSVPQDTYLYLLYRKSSTPCWELGGQVLGHRLESDDPDPSIRAEWFW